VKNSLGKVFGRIAFGCSALLDDLMPLFADFSLQVAFEPSILHGLAECYLLTAHGAFSLQSVLKE